MNRSNSWTPHSYPVQSIPQAPPNARKTTAKHGEKPPRVPRNIRAVNDGKADPPAGRTIIVCLDGTGDKFDGDNSNIVHFVSCLKKSDPNQITYYQSGIGTYDKKGLSNGFNAGLDMAVGSGLGVHIRDAYKFLMQTYRENDRICMFGFSRGAYTARCLAGMVHKVGLLPAHNVSQIDFAYQYYKADNPEGWEMSKEFKRTFCMDVSVHFIGVFDSVASVGFIPRRLPLSSTPTNKARYFRHAMALDEHRAKFKVCRFQKKDNIEEKHWEVVAEEHENALYPRRRTSTLSSNGGRGSLNRSSSVRTSVPDVSEELEKDVAAMDVAPPPNTKLSDLTEDSDVLEVWFTGCHADVGGGAVKNEERHKLSQIPLRWMLRQCFECDTGIIFKTHRLAEEGIDVHTLYPTYTSLEQPKIGPAPSHIEKYEEGGIPPISKRSTLLEPVDHNDPMGMHDVKIFGNTLTPEMRAHWMPEQVEDYFDALSPINDQLVQAKGWWVLEAWPIKVRLQPKNSDTWIKKIRMNMGRYRPVQDLSPNLHWTVRQRMEIQGYKPQVRLDRKSGWVTAV